MAQTTYKTKPGDRWDLIAFSAYGDITKISDLITANPRVPISAVIAENTVLNIPIKENALIKAESLPPWKR
jgi:phage tail protein X